MVYFFVPNIISYIRVFLAAAAFYVAFENPGYFSLFYALSVFMDAIDGHAARYFNQCTKFGAVLDMVTDRCSTTALLLVLSRFYPHLTNLFIIIIAVDITSHYAHLYASLSKGESSHKNVDKDTNVFLRLYYGNRNVLLGLCAANEAIFLFPYILYHDLPIIIGLDVRLLVTLAFWLVLPFGLAKQFMNVVQLIIAFRDLAVIDRFERDAAGTPPKKRQAEVHETDENAESVDKASVSLLTRRALGAASNKTS